jgi:nitrate reductase beta subunit
MTTTAKTVSALAIAALLSLALFLSPVGISRAQEDDATEDTTEDATEDGATDDDIAAELGVTSDELTGAFRTVAIERIQEKVADGTITQERADEIIERIESSEGLGFGFGHRGHGRGHGHRGMGGAGGDAGVAESGSEI